MIQALLAEVVDNCPSLLFEDITDYSESQAIGTYSIHDYSQSTPAINTEFIITSISVDGVDILGTPVNTLTDPLGNLFDPNLYYQNIIDNIEATQNVYRARLIKASGSSFRSWYLEIYAFGTGYDGLVVSSVSGLTPAIEDIAGGEDIDFRNVSLLSPDGCYLDLGGVKQKDAVSFLQPQYTVGSIITLTYCDEQIVYTVTERNSRDCIIEDVVNEINSKQEGRFCSIVASKVGTTIELEAREPGVPFSVDLEYSLGLASYFTYVNVTTNQSTMDIPSVTASNIYNYSPDDRGGKFLLTLTIGQGCDYTSDRQEFFNWCFDRQSFDCCFISLVTSVGCSLSRKNEILSASNLRNIIKGIGYMQENNYDPNDIQKLVDAGWSICEPLNCSGKMNTTSKTSGSGDCGCGCGGSGNCK